MQFWVSESDKKGNKYVGILQVAGCFRKLTRLSIETFVSLNSHFNYPCLKEIMLQHWIGWSTWESWSATANVKRTSSYTSDRSIGRTMFAGETCFIKYCDRFKVGVDDDDDFSYDTFTYSFTNFTRQFRP